MAKNKNGIRIAVQRKKQVRRPIEGLDLVTRRFKLKSDEHDVEVVVPVFSPVLEVLRRDGWEEIYE